mmetsp:Transcript_2286/g.3603  ORF Transcript_2286/g.3603 Transcript_2286/m.3603 type:complete len:237 (+) Transcript_2286:44-754(+)
MSKSGLELLNDLIAELDNAVKCNAAATPSESAAESNRKSDKQPKENKGKPNKATAPVAEKQVMNLNALDLRVGIIRTVSKHETAEKLYCEEIDVGEEAPRPIASGLVPHYTLDAMQDRKLIVVCNLKPRNLVGFKSHGMVLCASKTLEDGTNKVEFVDPPAASQPGDKITGEGLTGEPLTASKCDKTKAFEVIAAGLKVDADGVANWNGHRLLCVSAADGTSDICKAPTVRDAFIS